MEHVRAKVSGDVDRAAGRELRILRNGADEVEISAVEQTALFCQGIPQAPARVSFSGFGHVVDDRTR